MKPKALKIKHLALALAVMLQAIWPMGLISPVYAAEPVNAYEPWDINMSNPLLMAQPVTDDVTKKWK